MNKAKKAFDTYWMKTINLPDEPEFPEIDSLAKNAFYAAFLAGWEAHKDAENG